MTACGVSYRGQGVTQDGLERLLKLINTKAVLDLGHDTRDLGDERALLHAGGGAEGRAGEGNGQDGEEREAHLGWWCR